MPLQINGLNPSADFPTTDFEAIYTKMQNFREKAANTQFVGAWSAIAHRFVAVAEFGERFTASVLTHGPAPSYPTRYEQERDLFGFYSSGVSVMEAFCFAAFAVGSIVDDNIFPLATDDDERKVSWRTLRAAYRKVLPNDPFLFALDAIDQDPALKEFRGVRNILTHRAVPGREFNVGGPVETASIPRLGFDIDVTATNSRRKEIARLLAEAMAAMRAFLDKRFP